MSQPSTSDNTMTSEEHDQEVEEYIWNLMGKSGLLSEMKSQIAQFVQNNGKTKEKVTVDVTRVNPAILSLIYEYLKWVGMKNTCTLLLCESPIQFDTSSFTFDVSTNGSTSPSVPELCTYIAEKRRNNNETGKSLNAVVNTSSPSPLPFMTSTPTSVAPSTLAVGAAAATLNQTFNVLSSSTKQAPQMSSNNLSGIITGTGLTSLSLSPPPSNTHTISDISASGAGATSNIPTSPTTEPGGIANGSGNISVFMANPSSKHNHSNIESGNSNTPNTTDIAAAGEAGIFGTEVDVSDASESEHTTTSMSIGKPRRHNDKKDKVKTYSHEKNSSESSGKNALFKASDAFSLGQDKDRDEGKDLKPCTSDHTMQQKSREQLQFGFMTEKQKMEALNKKFSGSELIPKNKSSGINSEDSNPSSTTTASNKTVSSSKGEKVKSLSLSKKDNRDKSEKDKESEPENLMDIANPWRDKSNHNNVNHNNNIITEPDFEDESISDLHNSTAEDITQDLSMDSDSKVIAANIAECDHLMKLK